MVIKTIQYQDKISIQNNEEVAEKNKVTDTNMNEIKNVVNNNANELEYLESKNQQLKEDLKGLPNATVKGENIDLKDSAEMRVLGFKVSGNSSQEGEPTPETPVEVECCGDNVNLFDKNNVTILDAIINSTSKVISSFFGCKTFYIPCQKNKQITISRKEGTRFIVGTTTSIPSLNAVCNQIKINNTGTSITLVTGDNDNYLVVFYYNSGSDILTEQEILDSIKIEQNSKATPYSKYGQGNINIDIENENKNKSQTYTIPTQQQILEDDYFDWENKEEVHIWEKYNFTGNEYFSVIAPGIYRYNAKANNLGIKPVNNGVVAKAICNRLKVETAAHVSSGSDYNNYFGISTTGTIDINMQDYETVENFKAKLKELYDGGTPLYIWYELEEVKRLPFTEEQIEISDKIENAKTYKGVTHIYSTDKVSPNMEVIYLKDIEMMIQGG